MDKLILPALLMALIIVALNPQAASAEAVETVTLGIRG